MVAQSAVEQVANIHPLPRPGMSGAPPPDGSAGGGSTLRPLAAPVPARAYHASQPHHHRQAQPLPPLQQQQRQHQQQLSPQAQLSPSTAEASPSLPPAAPFHRSHVDAVDIPVGEKGRAQIACLTCRRSKTRCVNQGSGSTCKHCEERNKVCQWGESMPVATAAGSLRRRESTVGDVDTPPRKRKRPDRPIEPRVNSQPYPYNGIRTHDNFLDSPALTPKVWMELFDIYEKHFASEFPFLHRTRFMKALYQEPITRSTAMKKESSPLPRPAHSPPLLLGFLTITARYHPELLSKWGLQPSACANSLADATEASLGPIPGKGSLERAQALLFLGFHRWSDLKGETGWYLIGLAGRYAQNLGYQKDEDHEETSAAGSNDGFAQQENFINREIQRRTFWSCFILDRYTSCVKKRDQLFDVNKIETQLPCKDEAFNHGQKVKTRLLKESDEKYRERRNKFARSHEHAQIFDHDDHQSKGHEVIEWEVGKEESELSLFIQAVNHFGEVLAWSNAKGRRHEDHPPWDERSGFFKLEAKNEMLKAALPRHLILTQHNTDTRIYSPPSKNYVTIHALHTLSTVALYREYLAFAPWHERRPVGPIDEPKISELPPQEDYWIQQARACFGACKAFADLLRSCRKADALVESVVAGWATYIVAWCALYCHMFPRMDPDRVLYSKPQAHVWELTNDIIFDMGDRFPMASQWSDNLARLRTYYYDYKAKMKTLNESPESLSSEEFEGGGLKDYSTLNFESEQKELGSLTDTSWSRRTNRDELKLNHDHESDNQSEATSPVMAFKGEDTRASTPASSWQTINAPPDKRKSTSEAPSLSTSSHTRYYASSPNTAPIRPSSTYNPPNESPEAHSMRPPATETTPISHAYNRGPDMYGPAPTALQAHWQQQQAQQQVQQQIQQQVQQQTRLDLEQMKQVGEFAVPNFDLHSWQLGEDYTVQDESSNHSYSNYPYMLSAYTTSYGIPCQPPYDESGPTMANS